MKINKADILKIKEQLQGAKSIGIMSHIHPDGDNLGSILGMYNALKINTASDITVIKTDDYPESFNFLPAIEELKEVEENQHYEILFVLDCGDEKRVGRFEQIISNADYVVNIDHHKTNTMFGDINIVDAASSATAELLYQVLELLDYKIDKNVATCLYTGISTDSGSFKYSSTTANTHMIAAKLIEEGIDSEAINVAIYQNRPYNKTLLFIESLNTVKMYHNNRLGIVYVDSDMLKKTDTSMLDSDGIVEFVRDIEGIEVACLIKIYDNEIKCSFRSKNSFDVSSFCEQHDGGGHMRAAGCTFTENIDLVIKTIIDGIVL